MLFFFLLDADCSGRTLATLLVAWVAAAMIASVLLRWEYMWIVLMILTLLFLLVCGYIAYTAKRAHMRALINERRRATNVRERRNRQIWTVSGMTSEDRTEMESSIYGNRLMDLPPSYASVVLAQETSTSPRDSPAVGDASVSEFKPEEPPPYSTVIPVAITLHDRNAGVSNESSDALPPSTPSTTKKNDVSSDHVRRARDD